jgi:hypothetical protein
MQTQQFNATVSGSGLGTVTWRLSPAVGGISASGLYTPPSVIFNPQTVTVTATSVADTVKSASAVISLQALPVGVSVSPTTISLLASATQQFNAALTGTSNKTVTWTLNPNVGAISNGLYTAPATINVPQTVTVTATSAADTTKSGSAQINLVPVVAVSLSPAGVTLQGSQTQQFTPSVTGTLNLGVTWSLNPNVGTISNGLYSAPTLVASSQIVTVTATSVVDTTKSASAQVTLQPVAVSLSPGSASLQASQSQQFTPTITGSSNTGVTWSLNPHVGTISSGLYTAPASLTSTQIITVTATSTADPTKSGSAQVTLVPVVAVSLSPASVTLQGSQTQQFTPSVTGTLNLGVTWSLNPNIGTISNGLYTAPAVVASSQVVTVTATSVADTTKSGSAQVTLQPVAVSLSPGSASLLPSQTQQFTPSVTGTGNTGVTWSLNPNVGTISGGLYTAPAAINSSQVVTVTATSAADTTKSGSAQVTLQPTAGVSLSPGSAGLWASQTQQFTPTVTGLSGTGVTWSLNPNVGTISTTGLYTAPATIAAQQQVFVLATSTADTTKSGQATVTLNPAAGPSALTLPVEAMGANGTVVSALVNIPNVPTGSNTMQMRIHGLRYETEASVQVNGSAWVPLNTATVTLLGNAAAYGGIGGGFSTLDMTVPLPAGAIAAGNNTVNFRFNATDGRTSGFRVLSFNFLDPNGNALVPSQAFVQDDPTTWQPPSSNPSDIAAGQALWHNAALTTPQSTGPVSIQAKCASCHAQDGRDLKYFNYSNYSIIARSMFHG